MSLWTVFGSWYPLMVLMFWYLFTLCASPYPLVAAAVVGFAFTTAALTLQMTFIGSSMPLEMYHAPRWLLMLVRVQLPWIAKRFSHEELEPAARRRAAELRAYRLGRARLGGPAQVQAEAVDPVGAFEIPCWI